MFPLIVAVPLSAIVLAGIATIILFVRLYQLRLVYRPVSFFALPFEVILRFGANRLQASDTGIIDIVWQFVIVSIEKTRFLANSRQR